MYRVSVEKSEPVLIDQLKKLGEQLRARSAITDGRLPGGSKAFVDVITFKDHLYQPLIKASGASITVKPVTLNEGEMQFVHDLKKYCQAHPEQFQHKPLFLLRNMSRGRGIGFFEAGNFYPDFILWRIDGDKQCITFVDPKGLQNMEWEGEPKLEFYKTIKDMQARLPDRSVTLQSFILSVTTAAALRLKWPKVTDAEYSARNILFNADEGYIERLVTSTLP